MAFFTNPERKDSVTFYTDQELETLRIRWGGPPKGSDNYQLKFGQPSRKCASLYALAIRRSFLTLANPGKRCLSNHASIPHYPKPGTPVGSTGPPTPISSPSPSPPLCKFGSQPPTFKNVHISTGPLVPFYTCGYRSTRLRQLLEAASMKEQNTGMCSACNRSCRRGAALLTLSLCQTNPSDGNSNLS